MVPLYMLTWVSCFIEELVHYMVDASTADMPVPVAVLLSP